VLPPYQFLTGVVAAALAASPAIAQGSIRIGGQEHFYLEGQIAIALPGEDGDIAITSSTQHPTEVQHIAARVLG
jgi:xanthine dehydrogenase large subunit